MNSTKELTRKQHLIYETIREIIEREGKNPTAYRIHHVLMEEGCDMGSLKGTVQVVEALERKQLLTRDESKRIYVVKNRAFANMDNIFSMPMYGLASCGEALAYADDNVDGFLQVSKSLFRTERPAQLFAVRALGDSMNNAGINDNDYVVFSKYEYQGSLEEKIVVAVINGMATIKIYRRLQDGMIGLFPHSTNDRHQPIYLDESDDVLIAGVFCKILPTAHKKSDN